MATDIYLHIDGIKGESTDSRYTDWIECQTAAWSVSQQRSATASTGGGHTSGRCEHGELVIAKLVDLSTPILLQTCSSGQTVPKVVLDFLRADGNGGRIRYFSVELENVLIGGIFPSLHEGQFLSEHVGLRYAKAKWIYTQQKIGGGMGGSTVGGWDLATNRVC